MRCLRGLASECHPLSCERRGWHHRVSALRDRVFDKFGRILGMVCVCDMHLRALALGLGMPLGLGRFRLLRPAC